ncbi:hypothetical protein LTR86_002638 [Recurvomyces mirabilis]|nr:hypothetical protein LTR86_002638 [Recurvomyces mirabilis]
MDHSLLSASAFNRIPQFQHQIHSISRPILEELAQLFVRYGTYHSWGLGLLHRHVHMPDGYLMVNDVSGEHTHFARIKALEDAGTLVPCAMHLNAEHSLQAFEYDADCRRDELSPTFATEFCKFALSHSLHNVIAVVSKSRHDWKYATETLMQDEEGFVYGMQTKYAERAEAEGVVTNWTFAPASNGVAILDVKVCKQSQTGIHEVVKDHGA